MNKNKMLHFVMALPLLLWIPCLLSGQNNPKLPQSLLPELRNLGRMISDGQDIQGNWKNLVSANQTIDVKGAINYVLTEAKTESQRKVDAAGKNVQFYTQLKKRVADEVKLAKEAYANSKNINTPRPLKRRSFGAKPGPHGNIIETDNGFATTLPEMYSYINEMEAKLNSIGDDAQLANIDMQQAMQQQQQTLQILSNISKLMADTAMAVIRKIGG